MARLWLFLICRCSSFTAMFAVLHSSRFGGSKCPTTVSLLYQWGLSAVNDLGRFEYLDKTWKNENCGSV